MLDEVRLAMEANLSDSKCVIPGNWPLELSVVLNFLILVLIIYPSLALMPEQSFVSLPYFKECVFLLKTLFSLQRSQSPCIFPSDLRKGLNKITQNWQNLDLNQKLCEHRSKQND